MSPARKGNQTKAKAMIKQPTFSTVPRKFASARDAIDAVSAFEEATREEWEYEIHLFDDDGNYVVKANALIRIDGKFFHGYLKP